MIYIIVIGVITIFCCRRTNQLLKTCLDKIDMYIQFKMYGAADTETFDDGGGLIDETSTKDFVEMASLD